MDVTHHQPAIAAARAGTLDLQERIDRLLLEDAERRVRNGAPIHQAVNAAGALPGLESTRLAAAVQRRHPLAFT